MIVFIESALSDPGINWATVAAIFAAIGGVASAFAAAVSAHIARQDRKWRLQQEKLAEQRVEQIACTCTEQVIVSIDYLINRYQSVRILTFNISKDFASIMSESLAYIGEIISEIDLTKVSPEVARDVRELQFALHKHRQMLIASISVRKARDVYRDLLAVKTIAQKAHASAIRARTDHAATPTANAASD